MAENPEFGYGSSVIKYTFPCGGIVYLRVTDQIKNRYENGNLTCWGYVTFLIVGYLARTLIKKTFDE